MSISEEKRKEMIAHEAFIRRAAIINHPFMLKGSYTSRQYFADPETRIPSDLDWVYLEFLSDEKTAREKFGAWVSSIAELDMKDGVRFRNFKENEFWRRIDYAMADDFPTVNTDIKCWVDEEELIFSLDVSFNLDIEELPVLLYYKPVQGTSFTIQNTAPLSLQISWKIHQTLVRPRFKDLFDLMHLIRHQSFNDDVRAKALQALVNECSADKVNPKKIQQFFSYDLAPLFPGNSIDNSWGYWRHKISPPYHVEISDYERSEWVTDPSLLPSKLEEFIRQFRQQMEKVGFTKQIAKLLPPATRHQRKKKNSPFR